MLYGGAPHLVAAMWALTGWFMVLAGTSLVYVTIRAALDGTFAALLPLPFAMAAYGLAVYAIRSAAEAIRSVIR